MSLDGTILLLLALLTVVLIAFLWITIKQRTTLSIELREVKKQKEDLENRIEQLHDLALEKHQLMSMVSHDLKGPFNRIFALVQLMLLTPENLTDDQKDYLGKIHQIIADGLTMIRNVLDNRRMEDRGIEVSLEMLNAAQLTASLLKNYISLAAKKKVKISFSSPEKIMLVSDKMSLSRILENLLSNALKFTPLNKHLFVRLEEGPTHVVIEVEDEGPGISKTDQQKLYQKFQPLTAKPTGGESSTGLGLSIVKALTEKLGGTVECESDEGKGAKFTVRLPKGIN